MAVLKITWIHGAINLVYYKMYDIYLIFKVYYEVLLKGLRTQSTFTLYI